LSFHKFQLGYNVVILDHGSQLILLLFIETQIDEAGEVIHQSTHFLASDAKSERPSWRRKAFGPSSYPNDKNQRRTLEP